MFSDDVENDVIFKNPVTKAVKYNIGKEPKKVKQMNLYVHVTGDEKVKEVERIESASKIV